MKGSVGLALFLWLISASLVLAADDGVTGTWKTADGRALIEIYRCGAKICGRVAWLREPCFPADDREGMSGKPRIDRYNPDPEKRNRRVIGLQIMEILPTTATIVGNMGPSMTRTRGGLTAPESPWLARTG